MSGGRIRRGLQPLTQRLGGGIKRLTGNEGTEKAPKGKPSSKAPTIGELTESGSGYYFQKTTLLGSEKQRESAARRLLNESGLKAPTYDQVKQVAAELLTAAETDKLEGYRAPLGAADQKPETLGNALEEKGLTPDELLTAPSYTQQQIATTLLQSKGIQKPTASQLLETSTEMLEAVEQGAWKSFSASAEPALIPKKDSIGEREGNFFFEKETFRPDDLVQSRLTMNGLEHRLAEGFSNGSSGMALAASFVNARRRIDGDFSQAYGEDSWRGFLRANEVLNAIPKGELLERLDVDLLLAVNRECFSNDDPGLMGAISRTMSRLKNGRYKEPGRLREWSSATSPEGPYSEKEYQNLLQAGVGFRELPGSKEGARKGMILYPPADGLKEKVEALIEKLKDDLQNPDADGVAAAADFQRHLVALHPCEDANGRTARLLMNRVLAELDLPPAILGDSNADMSLSPDDWRAEVKKGVARSKRFLDGSTGRAGFEAYLSKLNLDVVKPEERGKVLLDGLPFNLGKDGLLYDPNGRPHLSLDGELSPLSQMEAFALVRRVGQMEPEAAKAELLEITKDTRGLHARAKQEGGVALEGGVPSDKAAREADGAYRMRPTRAVGELLVRLADVEKLDPAELWTVGKGAEPSAEGVFSKYGQMDLELWHLARGLNDAGHGDLADKVEGERGKLFDKAKEALAASGDESRVSDENPHGFKKAYEQLMHEASPLRHESYEAYKKADNDDMTVVWRGDWSINRFIGIGPNSDMRQKDAKAIQKDRQEAGKIGHVLNELQSLQASADGNNQTASGSQYTCTTTNLGFLTGSFGDGTSKQTLNLSAVPDVIVDQIAGFVESRAEQQLSERRAAGEEPGKDEEGTLKVEDVGGVQGTLMSFRLKEKDFDVELHRKVFQMRVPRENLLPGNTALEAGMGFHAEQEAHAVGKIWPWQIKRTFTKEQISEELPVTKPELQLLGTAKASFANAGLVLSPDLEDFLRQVGAKVPFEESKSAMDDLRYGGETKALQKLAELAELEEPRQPALVPDSLVQTLERQLKSKFSALTPELKALVTDLAASRTVSKSELQSACSDLKTLEALAKERDLSFAPPKVDVERFVEKAATDLGKHGLAITGEVRDWLAKGAEAGAGLDELPKLGWGDAATKEAFLQAVEAAAGPPPTLGPDVEMCRTALEDACERAFTRFDAGMERFLADLLEAGASYEGLVDAVRGGMTQEAADSLADAHGVAAPKLEIAFGRLGTELAGGLERRSIKHPDPETLARALVVAGETPQEIGELMYSSSRGARTFAEKMGSVPAEAAKLSFDVEGWLAKANSYSALNDDQVALVKEHGPKADLLELGPLLFGSSTTKVLALLEKVAGIPEPA